MGVVSPVYKVLCGVLLLRVGCSGQMCNYCLLSLFVFPCLCGF